jgi:signal transduction histidine kinase
MDVADVTTPDPVRIVARGPAVDREPTDGDLPSAGAPAALAAYGLATAAVITVLAVKLALVPWVEHDTPFLLFFAAVLVAAWYGGLGPGLFATALSAAASAYFFMAPYRDIRVAESVQRVRLAMFTAEGVFISALAAFLQHARRCADAAAAESRRLERQILRASEEARRLVGHDLHDGLGQHLAGAAMRARVLVRRLDAGGSPDAADARVVEELLSRSVAWTRDLAAGLSPTGCHADGLPAALSELAAQTERTYGVRCRFHAEPNTGGLGEEAAPHLYSIAQEAVGNAARHARPSLIRVALSRAPGVVILTVEDDGTGIAAPRQGGSGMHTMRYRAQLIGARLEVRRLAPRGTAVTCFCPRRNQ